MKKVILFLICLLFVLTGLFPFGTLISACFGYTFELISAPAFAVVTTVLSVCVVILDIGFKNTVENKAISVLLSIITPLSLINGVFYIFECSRGERIWVVAGVLISTIGCFFLTLKHGRPLTLKIIALVLSALMVYPVGLFSFAGLVFGEFGQNTVVQTAESPNGKYRAEVIDSDQGALGGDTIVNVCEKIKIDFVIFKIEKKPQLLYLGEWGEFENMEIYWKDNRCLVINSVEYEME